MPPHQIHLHINFHTNTCSRYPLKILLENSFSIAVPKHQIQNLFNGTRKTNGISNNNSDNKKLAQPKVRRSASPVAVATVKVKAPSKPKPKNVETGVVALNVTELQDMIYTYKSSFPDSHLVWLKMVRLLPFHFQQIL